MTDQTNGPEGRLARSRGDGPVKLDALEAAKQAPPLGGDGPQIVLLKRPLVVAPPLARG